jgi:hypothetical protein
MFLVCPPERALEVNSPVAPAAAAADRERGHLAGDCLPEFANVITPWRSMKVARRLADGILQKAVASQVALSVAPKHLDVVEIAIIQWTDVEEALRAAFALSRLVTI